MDVVIHACPNVLAFGFANTRPLGYPLPHQSTGLSGGTRQSGSEMPLYHGVGRCKVTLVLGLSLGCPTNSLLACSEMEPNAFSAKIAWATPWVFRLVGVIGWQAEGLSIGN